MTESVADAGAHGLDIEQDNISNNRQRIRITRPRTVIRVTGIIDQLTDDVSVIADHYVVVVISAHRIAAIADRSLYRSADQIVLTGVTGHGVGVGVTLHEVVIVITVHLVVAALAVHQVVFLVSEHQVARADDRAVRRIDVQ